MNVKIILCAAKGKEYDKKGIEEKGRNCVKNRFVCGNDYDSVPSCMVNYKPISITTYLRVFQSSFQH